ncbi:MAG: hypothetical protein ACRC3B_11150, partial [Bacteroidia bacterium]
MKKFTIYFPLFIILVLFAGSQTLNAQETLQPERGSLFIHYSNVGLVNFNGMKLGADYVLQSKEIQKSKRKKTSQTLRSTHYLTFNYGFYSRSTRSVNHLLHVGYLMQKTKKNGWFTGIEPIAGFRLNTSSYINENNPGFANSIRPRLMTGVSFSVGKEMLLGKKEIPFSVFGKYTLMTSLPRL